MRLLLAEDERALVNVLTAILRHNNYSVDAVFNGDDALDYALSGAYDGLILDVMMPGKNGFEVVSAVREHGLSVPVLMLTAKSAVRDRVEGLDCGADDYLTKPFSTDELLARIRALLRRNSSFAPNVLTCGGTSLDRSAYELSSENGSVRLSGKEFQVIETFMQNPRVLISANQLMEKIWGWDSESEINVVWVCISSLRKKLASVGSRLELRSARGVGYSLEEKQ